MVVHAHPILYIFMFLKISIRKSLRKKKGKSVTFSLKVPPGLVPCDLELPSLLPRADSRAVPCRPHLSQGQRLQQKGTWGFLTRLVAALRIVSIICSSSVNDFCS